MALNISTQTGLSQRTTTYAMREMLRHAEPVIVLGKMGMTKPMPKNKGVNVKFRRPNVFAAVTSPLVEGVTPASTTFTYTDVSGVLKQYGQVVEITDVIEDTHEDPVLNDITEQCGENIGRTTEALNYAALKGGTTVFYANGASRATVNTAISLAKQRAVTRYLKAQKAKKLTKVMSSSRDYGTQAIEASYVAVAHTDLENDIRGLPGFVPTADYGNRKVICEEEIGTVEDVRYVLSPDLDSIAGAGSGTLNGMVSDGGSNVDIYPVLFFGRDAFGTVPLKGKEAISPSIISAKVKTKDDPLGQRGVVGWLTWHLCLILNESWMGRLECGATDL